jgi:hypothetical protein
VLDQAAQEGVADEDVDPRLRVLVDPGRQARGDRGIEVRHLDLDVDADLVPVVVVEAGDLDLEVAVALAALRGDEQALLDPPAHDPGARVHLVLRGPEGQQLDERQQQDDVALGLRVVDPHEAERVAREGLPVRPREALEVLGVPEPVEGGLGRMMSAPCTERTAPCSSMTVSSVGVCRTAPLIVRAPARSLPRAEEEPEQDGEQAGDGGEAGEHRPAHDATGWGSAAGSGSSAARTASRKFRGGR